MDGFKTKLPVIVVVLIFFILFLIIMIGYAFYYDCGETIYNTKQDGNKFLVVGSAPYMKDWVDKHMQWFVDEGFRILPMNNAHKLIPPSLINEWHKPGDHRVFGSFPIEDEEYRQMQSVVTHCGNNSGYVHLYKRNQHGGTMLFNTLYYLLHKNNTPITVVVVGTDMIYKKQGDTFYSHLPQSNASNDPVIKYSDEELKEELLHIQNLYRERNHTLLNASDQQETRLPFPRFTQHLIPQNEQNIVIGNSVPNTNKVDG